MSEERIKQLLQELLLEVEKTEDLDEEAMTLFSRFQGDVQDLINPEIDSEGNNVVDDAIALEASFAASHPTAEYIIRELINSLARMGV